MKDYHHTWYNNPEWEFKYVLSVAKKPRFKDIDNIENHVKYHGVKPRVASGGHSNPELKFNSHRLFQRVSTRSS